jgi:hypothetical protein
MCRSNENSILSKIKMMIIDSIEPTTREDSTNGTG